MARCPAKKEAFICSIVWTMIIDYDARDFLCTLANALPESQTQAPLSKHTRLVSHPRTHDPSVAPATALASQS
jgi:hypothetical protein